MKKTFKSSIYTAFVVAMLTQSCNKDQIGIATDVHSLPISEIDQVDKIVLYRGTKVRVPAGVPSKIFLLETNEQVNVYLNQQYSKAGARGTALSTTDIDNVAYFGLVSEVFKRYLDTDLPIHQQKDLQKIYKDFPDFKTVEDLQKNSDIIVDYYNRLVINELKGDVLKFKSSSGAKKLATSDYSSGSPCERQQAENDPFGGLMFFNAATDAENWTDQYFSSHLPDGWRGNAFKHAVWNAQGVRKMIIGGRNHWTAYEAGRVFATMHELICPSVDNRYLDTNDSNVCMDLHNNVIGRTYIKRALRFNIWGSVTGWPSEDALKDEFFTRCNNPNPIDQNIRIGNREFILGLTYNDANALSTANYVGDNWYRPAALNWNP